MDPVSRCMVRTVYFEERAASHKSAARESRSLVAWWKGGSLGGESQKTAPMAGPEVMIADVALRG